MISGKKIITRVLFGGEIVLFLANFLFGTNGLSAILDLQHENIQLIHEIEEIKSSLMTMEEQLLQWNRYPFYKEKVAREELQMVHDNEIVYFNV